MTKKIVSFITSAVFAVLCVTPYNTAAAADTGLVEIASAEAEAGETVELPIEMKTNPGIAAMSLLLSYDTDKLELISVADGKILGSSSFTPGGDVTAVPYKLNWDDLAAENNTGTGTLATASFRVKDGVSGEAKVTAQIDQSSTFDVDYTEIPFEIISGSISITSHGSSSEPTITVSSVSAAAGQETEVPVMLECNPGVAAMSLALTYDTDKLELLGASDGKILGSSTFSPGNDLTAVPYKLNWDDLSTENNTGNGILVTLRFMVRDGASGEAEVCLKVDQKSTFNIDFTEVPFEVVNGSISIKELTTTSTSSTTTTTTSATPTATTTTTTSTTTTSTTSTSATTTVSTSFATTTTSSIVIPTFFGDVNNDGRVNSSDYIALTQYLSDREKYSLTAQGASNADIYNRGDGIDEKDAAALFAWLNGEISRLPYDGTLPGSTTTSEATTSPATTTVTTEATTTTTVPDNSLQGRARAIIASIGTDPHEIYKYVSGNNSYKSLGTVNSYSQIEKLGWEYFAEYALNNKYVSSEYYASVSSLLFEAAGHENRIVMGTGRGTGLYYWNQVLVNGEWLNFDACNGFDGEPTDYLEKPGYETGKGYTTDAYIYHSFFNGTPTTTEIPTVTTTALTTTDGTTTTTTPTENDLGDVNEDGKIDAKDASLILVAYAKISTGSEGGLTERQYKSADVNSDGKSDAKDASSILAYYAFVSTTTRDVPTLKDFITG